MGLFLLGDITLTLPSHPVNCKFPVDVTSRPGYTYLSPVARRAGPRELAVSSWNTTAGKGSGARSGYVSLHGSC